MIDIFAHNVNRVTVSEIKHYRDPEIHDGFYFRITIETDDGRHVQSIHCNDGAVLDGIYPATEIKNIA